jgi:hypothetical protein
MARSNHSHLAAQVAALRKLVEARLGNASGPVYLRDGSPIPDGVDLDRVVWIKRTFVEPPARVEDELPATQVENIGADDLASQGARSGDNRSIIRLLDLLGCDCQSQVSKVEIG